MPRHNAQALAAARTVNVRGTRKSILAPGEINAARAARSSGLFQSLIGDALFCLEKGTPDEIKRLERDEIAISTLARHIREQPDGAARARARDQSQFTMSRTGQLIEAKLAEERNRRREKERRRRPRLQRQIEAIIAAMTMPPAEAAAMLSIDDLTPLIMWLIDVNAALPAAEGKAAE